VQNIGQQELLVLLLVGDADLDDWAGTRERVFARRSQNLHHLRVDSCPIRAHFGGARPREEALCARGWRGPSAS